MGERSKKLGDHGEDIVASLLELIGWKSPLKGIDLSCFKPSTHGSAESPRRSHGVDFVFSSQSQLEDQTLNHTLISSKFTAAPYPSNPSNTFKEHFTDLAIAIECFKKSEVRRRVNSSYQGIMTDSISGALFWLSGNSEPDAEIVSKIANSRNIDDFSYGTIYVIDNYRAKFLFDTINFANGKYGKENVRFNYPYTGKNNDTTSRVTSGPILPPEYLNSGLIPFHTVKDNQKHLLVCCQDLLDEISLNRLIGFSMLVALEYPNKIILAFPDYDFVKHDEMISTAKLSLSDKNFAQCIEVTSFLKDFRGVE
ncbi:GapS4a family protein [Pseudomonas solani]|uniref:GapS4a family protein n=1 Tax=Pseudomonas solani TaxID=2731552 RepID=UPI003C2D2E7D